MSSVVDLHIYGVCDTAVLHDVHSSCTCIHLHMSYISIVLNIIPTLYEGYTVSVHRMVVMENRPVDPGSIPGVTDLYPS